MLDAIAKPFGWLMLQLYNFVDNYGVAVILFALIVKLIMLPFQLKSKKSMMKTSRMTPRLKELEKKFGNDQQRYQQEMNKLYKEEGVNPMSGCLWSLIPFPILLALYRAIRFPLTTMMGVSSDLLAEGGAIYNKLAELGYSLANYSTGRNASVYEQIFQSQFITDHFADFQGLSDKLTTISYKFLGMDLGQTPKVMFWNQENWPMYLGLFLIPIVSALLSYVSMKVSNASNPQAQTEQNKQMNTMMLWMPLISLWICFTMPAVMGIYWIAQSAFAIIQDLVLTKVFNKQLDVEDAERIEREKARAAELEAKRAETERQKAEGTTQVNKNTSKKRQQAAAAQKEAERKAAEARAVKLAKRGPQEIPDSQVGNRRYARGRAYVADRYSNPDEAAAKTELAAEESAAFDEANPPEDTFVAVEDAEGAVVAEDTEAEAVEVPAEDAEVPAEEEDTESSEEAEAEDEPEEPAESDDSAESDPEQASEPEGETGDAGEEPVEEDTGADE